MNLMSHLMTMTLLRILVPVNLLLKRKANAVLVEDEVILLNIQLDMVYQIKNIVQNAEKQFLTPTIMKLATNVMVPAIGKSTFNLQPLRSFIPSKIMGIFLC